MTDVYILRNKPPVTIDGKRRATLSGISFVKPTTPIRLADEFKVKGAYKLDFPNEPLTGPSRMETSVINGTYRGFMEVILQNNETKMHSYHMDGYAFFVVGYENFFHIFLKLLDGFFDVKMFFDNFFSC